MAAEALGLALLKQLAEKFAAPLAKATLEGTAKAVTAPARAVKEVAGGVAQAGKLLSTPVESIDSPEAKKLLKGLTDLAAKSAVGTVRAAIPGPVKQLAKTVSQTTPTAEAAPAPEVPEVAEVSTPEIPFVEGARDALLKAKKDSGAAKVEQGLEAGASIATIEQGVNKFEQGVQAQSLLNRALAGGSSVAKFFGIDPSQGLINQGGVNPKTGKVEPASSLFGLLRESPQDTLARQELAGRKKLQEGEREKLRIESQNKFFENIATGQSKPLSGESSKILGNVNSGLEQVANLQKILTENPAAFKQMVTPGNTLGQIIKTSREDLIDILGRLRSGGAINEDEFKSFARQIPPQGFFKGRLETAQTMQFKLEKLKKLMLDIRLSIQPQDSGFSSRVVEALKAGATREQVFRLVQSGSF